MRVTTIIPCYNGASFLKECIESVLNQRYPAHEIIVVDDGSTDDSVGVGRAFGSRVRVISQRNAGPGVARNLGVLSSSGDIVIFLDADDRVVPDGLEKQLKVFRDRPSAGEVFGSVRFISGDGVQIGVHQVEERSYPVADLVRDCANPIYLASAAFSRAALARAGLFDTSFPFASADDWDLHIRMANCCEVAATAEVVAEYRIHSSNNSKDAARMYHGRIRALEKARNANEDRALRSDIRGALKFAKRAFASARVGDLRQELKRGRILHAAQKTLELLRLEPLLFWRLFRERRERIRKTSK